MRELEDLLVVQQHDTAIAQLIHKRAELPQRATIAEIDASLATIAAERAPVLEQRAELRKRQSLLEDDTSRVENKRIAEDKKLYSGAVTGVKELQALQDEIASLVRRQSNLEEQILMVMEESDPVDATLAEFDSREKTAGDTRTAVVAELDAAEAAIDAELETERSARDAAASAVDAALLERYDGIRSEAAGIGIARFAGGRCEGCHLSMSAMEADRIKKAPADEILTCESCERILVR